LENFAEKTLRLTDYGLFAEENVADFAQNFLLQHYNTLREESP